MTTRAPVLAPAEAPGASSSSSSSATIEIVKPGPLMTVQDLGRPGWGRFGVSPSGAMDPLAARAANRLAGNQDGAAVLEITGAGGALRFVAPCRIGLCGGDLGAELAADSPLALPLPRALAPASAAAVEAGQQLRFTARRRGARSYLAVAGGLDVPLVFGSAATDLSAGIGGLGGRPLRAGDRLHARAPAAAPIARAQVIPERAPGLESLVADVLRFVAAPGAPEAAVAALTAAPYRVAPRSNRAGYQLEGAALPLADGGRLSEPIAPGTIQVLPDGQPILLMADRQTIGGYPVIGWLAGADLGRAAQLWPADRVSFAAISAGEARAALRAQETALCDALAAWPA